MENARGPEIAIAFRLAAGQPIVESGRGSSGPLVGISIFAGRRPSSPITLAMT